MQAYHDQLHRRTQRATESVNTYTQHFIELVHRLSYEPTNEAMVALMHRGLLPRIQQQLKLARSFYQTNQAMCQQLINSVLVNNNSSASSSSATPVNVAEPSEYVYTDLESLALAAKEAENVLASTSSSSSSSSSGYTPRYTRFKRKQAPSSNKATTRSHTPTGAQSRPSRSQRAKSTRTSHSHTPRAQSAKPVSQKLELNANGVPANVNPRRPSLNRRGRGGRHNTGASSRDTRPSPFSTHRGGMNRHSSRGGFRRSTSHTRHNDNNKSSACTT